MSVGYSFSADIKLGKVANDDGSEKPKKERKSRKPRAEKVQQPQDSAEVIEPEQLPDDAEEKLLTDDEILEAAKQDTVAQPVEVLAGDTFRDETEVAEDAEAAAAADDEDEDKEDEDDEEEDETSSSDDTFGRGGDISDEQADYRREAFREMEGNGAWD